MTRSLASPSLFSWNGDFPFLLISATRVLVGRGITLRVSGLTSTIMPSLAQNAETGGVLRVRCPHGAGQFTATRNGSTNNAHLGSDGWAVGRVGSCTGTVVRHPVPISGTSSFIQSRLVSGPSILVPGWLHTGFVGDLQAVDASSLLAVRKPESFHTSSAELPWFSNPSL